MGHAVGSTKAAVLASCESRRESRFVAGYGHALRRDLPPVYTRFFATAGLAAARHQFASGISTRCPCIRRCGNLSLPSRSIFWRFRLVDVGCKAADAGSVVMRTDRALFEGNGPGDPIFCRSKKEESALRTQSTCRGTAALGQRAIHPMCDLVLGWANGSLAVMRVRKTPARGAIRVASGSLP